MRKLLIMLSLFCCGQTIFAATGTTSKHISAMRAKRSCKFQKFKQKGFYGGLLNDAQSNKQQIINTYLKKAGAENAEAEKKCIKCFDLYIVNFKNFIHRIDPQTITQQQPHKLGFLPTFWNIIHTLMGKYNTYLERQTSTDIIDGLVLEIDNNLRTIFFGMNSNMKQDLILALPLFSKETANYAPSYIENLVKLMACFPSLLDETFFPTMFLSENDPGCLQFFDYFSKLFKEKTGNITVQMLNDICNTMQNIERNCKNNSWMRNIPFICDLLNIPIKQIFPQKSESKTINENKNPKNKQTALNSNEKSQKKDNDNTEQKQEQKQIIGQNQDKNTKKNLEEEKINNQAFQYPQQQNNTQNKQQKNCQQNEYFMDWEWSKNMDIKNLFTEQQQSQHQQLANDLKSPQYDVFLSEQVEKVINNNWNASDEINSIIKVVQETVTQNDGNMQNIKSISVNNLSYETPNVYNHNMYKKCDFRVKARCNKTSALPYDFRLYFSIDKQNKKITAFHAGHLD